MLIIPRMEWASQKQKRTGGEGSGQTQAPLLMAKAQACLLFPSQYIFIGHCVQ